MKEKDNLESDIIDSAICLVDHANKTNERTHTYIEGIRLYADPGEKYNAVIRRSFDQLSAKKETFKMMDNNNTDFEYCIYDDKKIKEYYQKRKDEEMKKTQSHPLMIEAKKVVVHFDMMRRVVKFQAMKKENLPKEYILGEKPFCFRDDNVLRVVHRSIVQFSIRKNDLLYEDEYQELIELLKQCGENLHNILEASKEERKNWKGTEVVEI